MPTIVCNVCTKSLRSPDHLIGKRVKCPGCGSPIQVTDPSFAAADPFAAGGGDYGGAGYAGGDYGGGGYTAGGRMTGWGRFNLGLAIVAINTLATGGLVVLLLLIGFMASSMSTLSTMLSIMLYVAVLGLLAEAVGFWFCSNIPRESGERGMVQAAFWFMAPGALVLALDVVLNLADYFSSRKLMAIFDMMKIAGMFGMLAALIFFNVSLRGIALSMQSVPLAKNVFSYLVYTAAMMPAFIIYTTVSLLFATPTVTTFRPGGPDPDFGPPGPSNPLSSLMPGGTIPLIVYLTMMAINGLWLAYICKLLRDLVSRKQKLMQ